MNLLIPCAGKSSRYQTKKPKYLLSMPDGKFMFQLAVEPFLQQSERVLFAVLREHDDQFQSKDIIQALIPGSEVMIIDEVTRGPAETVYAMLEQFNVEGSFLIKDTDSYFKPQGNYDPQSNYVSLCSARDVRDVKLYNKSFAVINDQGYIMGMVEKEIASEFFSCGGYYFASTRTFMESFHRYDRLQVGGEFFIAQVIDLMIGAGHVFLPMHCHAYEDWGTHEDWVAYRKRIAIYFFDLDGVIYENGSPFWKPKWGENPVIPEAREKVNQLYDQGNYIVLITSRPINFEDATIAQLKRDGVKYHQIMIGVYHGTRVLINDYGPTNPYPSAIAINTARNSADFIEKIRS